jgi:hypothetical protein
MKKVISAQTVKQAHKEGKKEISAPAADFIITPEARTVAHSLGIQLVQDSVLKTGVSGIEVNESMVREIVARVYRQIPDAESRTEEIKKAVLEVVSEYVKK